MLNRRGVTPLQPVSMSGAGSTPPSPARSNQVLQALQQANTPVASTSPTRRTPAQRYKNSSDNIAAVLGSSSSFTPTNRTSQTRGQSTPATTAVRTSQSLGSTPQQQQPQSLAPIRQSTSSAGLLQSSSSSMQPSTPTNNASSTPFQYEFKVLSSSGKTSSVPIQLTAGSGGLQGFRPTMEDEHFTLLNATVAEGQPLSIVGILDGHCGRRVADLGSKLVPDCLLSHPALGQNNALALAESIVQSDRSIFQAMGKTDGGSTLICAAIHGRMLFVACLGDARAVVYDGGATIAMSEDHKPTDIKEQQRIVRCGGTVQFGRVCGCLAVSRALGDYEFKFSGNRFSNNRELMVSNLADVTQINITDSTKFLVLACDGLWDVLSNEESTKFVVDYLRKLGDKLKVDQGQMSKILDDCALKLADYAIERGSMDNVSVTIVFFHDVAQTIAQEGPAPSSDGNISNNNKATPARALPAPPASHTNGLSLSPQKRTPLAGRR